MGLWRSISVGCVSVALALVGASSCTNKVSVFDQGSGGAGQGGQGASPATGGGGSTTTCEVAGDCPGLDSDCRTRACVDDVCAFVDAPLGTVCDDDGNSCNSSGECVECVLPSDCPEGEQCVAEQCVAAQCVNGLQDGDETDVDCGGSCVPCDNGSDCDGPSDCVSGFCNGGTCAPCSSDNQCPLDQFCGAGVCSDKKAPGAICADPNQCQSGFCPAQDGVCCSSACGGLCEACSQGKTGVINGTCAVLAGGVDPDMECAASPPSTCGASGMGCSGLGAFCALYDTNTECQPAFCSNAMLTLASQCNGNGQCIVSPGLFCSPFGCNAAQNACATSCSAVEPCAPGFFCQGGTCVPPLGNGQPCSSGPECASGSCVDGVCCNQACSGQCQACVQSKTGQPDGSCSAVSANTDPDMECSDTGGPCGSNGSGCNGNPLSPGCNGYSCSCTQQYTSLAIQEICPAVSLGQCKLRINAQAQSCDSVCAQGGGECVGAFNDSPNGTCGQSNQALACNFTGFSSILCLCSSGCGAHASCSPPLSCGNGLCQ
jgi:hypothetical protein